MLGWTVLIVSMSVYFFTLYGFLTYNVLTRNITYFAIGIEVVLFALALVDRVNIIRKQHRKAQDDLVMATIKNENIILQYNQELESEVALKTMELAEKAKKLECANKEITAINEEMSATVEELHETLNKVKEQSEIIKEQSEEILKNNLNLELIIAEKTNLILVQNEQLKAYAHANSHKVRGPLARIMGLITLLSVEPDKQKGAEYMRMLEQCAGELDLIIREMNAILHETGYYSTQEVHN